MDLACAHNLFAFRPSQTCSDDYTPPKSGLYIDDLQGISLASMSQLGKHTYKNAQEALESKMRLAIGWLFTALESEMIRVGYMMPQQQPVVKVGCYTNDYLDADAGVERGAIVMRTRECTPLSVLYLHTVTYKGDTAENLILRVYNHDTNTLLDSFPFSAVAGKVATILADRHYSVSVRLTVAPTGEPSATKDACDCLCQYDTRRGHAQPRRYKHLRIIGFDGTDEVTETFGLLVCGVVKCYLPALICLVLPTVSPALYYRVGAMLLSEMLTYQAPTDYTGGYVAKSPLEQQQKYYMQESDKALRVAVATMVQNLHDVDNFCVNCKTPYSIVKKSL